MRSPHLILCGLCNEGMPSTRHSVGAALVSFLASSWGARLQRDAGGAPCDVAEVRLSRADGATAHVLLAPPHGFMNLSGRPVAQLLRSRGAAPSAGGVLIAHDGAGGGGRAGRAGGRLRERADARRAASADECRPAPVNERRAAQPRCAASRRAPRRPAPHPPRKPHLPLAQTSRRRWAAGHCAVVAARAGTMACAPCATRCAAPCSAACASASAGPPTRATSPTTSSAALRPTRRRCSPTRSTRRCAQRWRPRRGQLSTGGHKQRQRRG